MTAAAPLPPELIDAAGVAIDLIRTGDRVRKLNAAHARNLAQSIREGGLGQPILIRPLNGGYGLVAGLHRLEAHRILERRFVPSIIREMTDAEARLYEIDENLIRQDLTALERIENLAGRLEIWAERNPGELVRDESLPKPKRGRPPKNFLKHEKIDGYVPSRMGFVAETAAETSLSGQSIYRALATFAGLPAALRQRLSGSPLADNDSLLRGLARIGDREEQARAAEALIAGKAKTVAAARAAATGKPVPAKAERSAAAEFERVWRRASIAEKRKILKALILPAQSLGWTLKEGRDG